MSRCFVLCALCLIAATTLRAQPAPPSETKPIDVPIAEVGKKFRLLGSLHEPLGSVVTMQGYIVPGPSKGYNGGPNVRVQRINGRATQEDIQIPISAYPFRKLSLTVGQTFEWEGYETGGYAGHPGAVSEKTGNYFGTTDHYFRLAFIAYDEKKIDPIVCSPADFADREALIEGRAWSAGETAYLVGAKWRLLVDPRAPWPAEFEGKTVEGMGLIRKTEIPDTFVLEKGQARLVQLRDQLQRQVELRGRLSSMNDKWWLEYRGINLHIENLKEMPGFHEDLRDQPVLITGMLDEATLPGLLTPPFGDDKDPSTYFIVRKAACKVTEALRSPERATKRIPYAK